MAAGRRDRAVVGDVYLLGGATARARSSAGMDQSPCSTAAAAHPCKRLSQNAMRGKPTRADRPAIGDADRARIAARAAVAAMAVRAAAESARTRVVKGKRVVGRVDTGGRRSNKKKKQYN